MKDKHDWETLANFSRIAAQETLHESKVFALAGLPARPVGAFQQFREYKRGERIARKKLKEQKGYYENDKEKI